MTATIRVSEQPLALPGERFHLLTRPDWSQVAWAARPSDRRGASLWFDGLASTGARWPDNPVTRVDVERDRAILTARLKQAPQPRHLLIGNAHYLNASVRDAVIDLAASLNASLTFGYEAGHGHLLHGTGIVDQALANDWEQVVFHKNPPLIVKGTKVKRTRGGITQIPPASPPQQANADNSPGTPPDSGTVPTVGFLHYRNWCRALLAPRQFRRLDRQYQRTFAAVLALGTLNRDSLLDLLHPLVVDSPWEQAVTHLRATQAATFWRGHTWPITLDDFSTWRHQPPAILTDADFTLLEQQADPSAAPIALMTIHNMPRHSMLRATYNTTDHTITSSRDPDHPISVPPAARRLVGTAHDYFDGPLLGTTATARVIKKTQQFLALQLGLPLTISETYSKVHPDRRRDQLPPLRPIPGVPQT